MSVSEVQRYLAFGIDVDSEATARAHVPIDDANPDRTSKGVTRSLGDGTPTKLTVVLCPVYLRGEAYLMLRNGKAAATEFQKFFDYYGLVASFPWGALARLSLARAYALDAETNAAARDQARTAYQNFLTLWKDTDPDIPIYKQAKAEYAKLR